MQQTVKCKKCGKCERLAWENEDGTFTKKWPTDFVERLAESCLCFDCDFWTEAFENPNTYVIKGYAYTVAPEKPAGGIRGHGGRKFRIRILSTGEIITTTNLWCRGNPSEHFARPDDAEWA